MQVVEDAEFFAAKLALAARPEDQLQPLRVDLGPVEEEDARGEVGVAREPAIARSLAPSKHRMDTGHELILVVWFRDEIIGPEVERPRGLPRELESGEKDHRGAECHPADFLEQFPAIDVG
ncbi:cell cycle response regulator CtrA [Verrucomicrobiota bacterium]|nr:cell cycle response regulator CtrA [Verrucomicrobiota bacterium]